MFNPWAYSKPEYVLSEICGLVLAVCTAYISWPTAAKLAQPPSSSAQSHLSPLSLTLLLSSHLPLLRLFVSSCASVRAADVYLSELPISAYCQWQPRKLITEFIVVPGMKTCCLHGCLWCLGVLAPNTHSLTLSHTHAHTFCHSPSTSPHVMPVTWFPGKRLSKSESDFYF